MSLVSIIIPVYNAADILVSTIESAIAQTHFPTEIIIVDDGSTDNSFELAKRYEGVNVKLIRQTNAGAGIARNKGLAHAHGDYFQFLDAGDLLTPDKIERQVQALKGSQTRVAVCNYVQFANDLEQKSNLPVQDQSSYIYSTDDPLDFLVNLWGGRGKCNFIQTNSWLVPKTLIENTGGWRNYRCPDDDGEFFARVLLESEGIEYVPKVVNYYRVSPAGTTLSSNKSKKYLQNSLLTIDLKHSYLRKKGIHPDMNRAIAQQYFRFAVYNYPQQKALSLIALKRSKLLKEKTILPVLGGNILQIIGSLFGWRLARLLRYYLRERKGLK